MMWVVLGIVLILLILATISYTGVKQVAWADKMQRLNTGSKAEWIAPEYVLQQVRNDYLMAVRWMRESAFHSSASQLNAAPYHLTGQSLLRYQKILAHYRTIGTPRYLDVMQADHYVEVRQFSENGERCHLIDRQTHRSIITYDYWSHTQYLTQAVEDAALVYTMVYDKHSRRWKIDSFVQQLPLGWRAATGKNARRIKLLSAIKPVSGRPIGRDH